MECLKDCQAVASSRHKLDGVYQWQKQARWCITMAGTLARWSASMADTDKMVKINVRYSRQAGVYL